MPDAVCKKQAKLLFSLWDLSIHIALAVGSVNLFSDDVGRWCCTYSFVCGTQFDIQGFEPSWDESSFCSEVLQRYGFQEVFPVYPLVLMFERQELLASFGYAADCVWKGKSLLAIVYHFWLVHSVPRG